MPQREYVSCSACGHVHYYVGADMCQWCVEGTTCPGMSAQAWREGREVLLHFTCVCGREVQTLAAYAVPRLCRQCADSNESESDECATCEDCGYHIPEGARLCTPCAHARGECAQCGIPAHVGHMGRCAKCAPDQRWERNAHDYSPQHVQLHVQRVREHDPHLILLGVELEVEHMFSAANEAAHTLRIIAGDFPGVWGKSDGSLAGGGLEVVTLPLTLSEHRRMWPRLLRVLRERGWRSSARCGLHIHGSPTSEYLALKVLAIEWMLDPWLMRISLRSRFSFERWSACKYWPRLCDRHARYYCTSMDERFEVLNCASCSIPERAYESSRSDRYRAVNMCALSRHGTIEFRYPHLVRLSARQLLAHLELVHAWMSSSVDGVGVVDAWVNFRTRLRGRGYALARALLQRRTPTLYRHIVEGEPCV